MSNLDENLEIIDKSEKKWVSSKWIDFAADATIENYTHHSRV